MSRQADRDAVPAPCEGSRFAAVVPVYQGLARLHCHWIWEVGALRQNAVHTVVGRTRWAPESDIQAWPSCEKCQAINVVAQQGRVVFLNCSHPTPVSLCSCTSNSWIVWPVRFNASARFTVPYASFTTASDPTSQTPPTKGCLSCAGKCSSTHRTAQIRHYSTIICSCPWATPCGTNPSPTNMKWISGWCISLPASPKPFDALEFKIPENGRKWLVLPIVTLTE